MEETARLTEAQLGPTHADTLRCKNNLAGIYRATGRLTQALPLLEAVLQGLQDRLGPDDPATLTCAYNLALTYRSAGRLDRAVPLLEATLRRTQARVGADHPDTLSTQAALGVVYRETHRGAEAVALLEAVHRRGRRYPELAWVGDVLLATYLQAGPKDRAVPLIAANLAAARKSLPAGSPELASQLAEVGSQFLQADAFAAGEPVLRECLTLRENLAAGDKPAVAAWQVANTRSMLGAALLGQGKHAEAEPLLVQGWEGLKAQEKTIPPQGRINLPAALARLVQLYEATAKPLAASPYRAELARRLTAELHRDLAWSLLWGWPR
jgi:tetratricopeptide (TPR) repeat protein